MANAKTQTARSRDLIQWFNKPDGGLRFFLGKELFGPVPAWRQCGYVRGELTILRPNC